MKPLPEFMAPAKADSEPAGTGVRPPELAEGQVALLPGSFGAAADGQPCLVGARCDACGGVNFPAHAACPWCAGEDLSQVPIGRTATLLSLTIAHVAPAGFRAPYVLGELRLAEGPRLVAQLGVSIDEARALQPSTCLTLSLGVLGEDENGLSLVGWSYRPSESEPCVEVLSPLEGEAASDGGCGP